MNKLLLLCMCIMLNGHSFPQNFFVDPVNGNDNNSGTSELTPWKTVSKVNGFDFNTSSGNIIVAFKRGGIWREQLTPADHGTGENNRIIFTAYGSGRKPMILGSNSLIGSVNDWTDRGSNIWSQNLSTSPFYLIFEKNSTATNWGYRQSSVNSCNSDYDFYYNGGVLYIYSIGNPAYYYSLIENPVRAFSIGEISGNYLTFDNLEVWGSFEAGIRTSGGDYVRITNCDIHHMGNVSTNDGDGLYIISSYAYIGFNKIWECGSHSSWSGQYGNYKVKNNIWEHNYIANNYYTGIDLQHINTGGSSGGHIVRFNTIIDSLPQSNYYDTGVGIQVLGKRDNYANVGWSWMKNIKIYGNIIIGHYLGINIGSVCDSIYIYNNTLVNSRFFFFETKTTGGEFSGTWTIPWHGWIQNNLVYQTFGSVMDISTDSNKVFNNNLYYSSSKTPFTVSGANISFGQWQNWNIGKHDQLSINANPLFTDYNSNNFTLQPNSPAIDAGVLLNSEFSIGFNGMVRPQGSGWDIGAYETYTGPDITPPRILYAELVNATTLKIMFSEPINSDNISNLNNYSINTGIIVLGAKDSSTVIILTTSPHLPGNYSITINGIYDLAGNLISSEHNFAVYSFALNQDNIVPTLLSVQITDADKLVLDFSEPIDSTGINNLDNYNISDGIQVQGTELSENGNRLTLITSDHDTNHVYSIYINNIQDLSGNKILSPNNFKFYKLLSIPFIGWKEILIDKVTASATTDSNTSPAKTLDGLVSSDSDPNSRWAAEVMPHWIQYDLGAEKQVNLIAISFYQWNNGRIYRYSISTSIDGNQWNDVIDNVLSSNQEWTINEFYSLYTRFIRITCLSSNDADWAGLWEARIFGTNTTTSVMLNSFDAEINSDGSVHVEWETMDTNATFDLERKSEGENFQSIAKFPGDIRLLDWNHYYYDDRSIVRGKYIYRVKKIMDGYFEYSDQIEIEASNSLIFDLAQNYPNPFNPLTTIEFSVPMLSFINLEVFDVLGNKIATLVNEEKYPGIYKIKFNASSLTSGIYFSRIKSGNIVIIKKMILLK